MTSRAIDVLRSAIGITLVIVAVFVCAAVQLAADDREDGR